MNAGAVSDPHEGHDHDGDHGLGYDPRDEDEELGFGGDGLRRGRVPQDRRAPSRLDGRVPARAFDGSVPAEADDPRFEEVVAAILARNPEHRIHPTLERVREACRLLGDPQQAYRVVHLAGTNGKTSTARMVERLVREHDLRTGRFTSPHLSDITERIAVDGEPISHAAFVRAWDDVETVVGVVDARAAEAGEPRLSFFEVLTLMAFAAFADAPVDVAVIETGLGGTWDTTNVVTPDVAVITPVSLDHETWLGSTVEEIAGQKAGIIKHGATVVLGRQEEEATAVLMAKAAAERVTVVREGHDFGVEARSLAVGGQLVSLRTRGGVYTDVLLPLHGAHQAENAATALSAAEALLAMPGGTLVPGLVEAAFADVSSPGRLEVLRTGPMVLVDSAHNPAGAQALAEAVAEAFTLSRLVGVVAVMGDKDVDGVLAALEPVLADVVVTRSSSPRSLEVAELAEIAEGVFGEDRVHVAERLDEAITMAVDLAESEAGGGGGGFGGSGAGVLVAGSVVLAGDARTLLARAGRRGRPVRNPKRMMAATTLISEALVVFFATLAAYSLSADRPVSYLVLGGALILVCVLAAGMLRTRAGYALGWLLQVVMVAGGFVVPMMFGIGAVFALIWFAAVRVGTRIEREQAEVARRLAEREQVG